jgi:chromosome segregation ATPase
MGEVKQLLGICESHEPTDRDKIHFKTLVRKLKQRNEQLQQQNDEMSHLIQSFRDGNYNASEGAKLLADERDSQLQNEIDRLTQEVLGLRRENHSLRTDTERTQQITSAVQSNSQAISDKMSELAGQVNGKDEQITQLKGKLQ